MKPDPEPNGLQRELLQYLQGDQELRRRVAGSPGAAVVGAESSFDPSGGDLLLQWSAHSSMRVKAMARIWATPMATPRKRSTCSDLVPRMKE